GDPAILLADISKAKDLFNWQPKKTLAEMFN
ncbi:MAG: GDP-mannose 4,6 dehydratase, partial [Actinomycetota bacterium]